MPHFHFRLFFLSIRRLINSFSLGLHFFYISDTQFWELFLSSFSVLRCFHLNNVQLPQFPCACMCKCLFQCSTVRQFVHYISPATLTRLITDVPDVIVPQLSHSNSSSPRLVAVSVCPGESSIIM